MDNAPNGETNRRRKGKHEKEIQRGGETCTGLSDRVASIVLGPIKEDVLKQPENGHQDKLPPPGPRVMVVVKGEVR